jgi:putative membrane protein
MDEPLALFNTIAALASLGFMLRGRRAIRRGERRRHAVSMVSAFAFSAAFLVGFVVRFVKYGPTPIRLSGAGRVLSYVVLIAHEPLAVISVPLVVVALGLAWRGQFSAHRELAAIAWPIWVWSCASGAVFYLLLHVIPRL